MAFTERATWVAPFLRLLLAAVLGVMSVACLRAQWPELLPLQVRSGSSSYLGLGLADINAGSAKKLKLNEATGVFIVAVEKGAAGDEAGIHPGDVILSYNGEKVLGAQQLIRPGVGNAAGKACTSALLA